MRRLKNIFKNGIDREPLDEAEGIVSEVISRGDNTVVKIENKPEDFVLLERHRIDVGERVRFFYDQNEKERVVRAYEIFDIYRKIMYRHIETGYELEVDNAERDDFF